MNYDFMFGCVFFVIMVQNLFIHFMLYEKSFVLDQMKDREFDNFKQCYDLKVKINELEHKLSSKS